MAKKRGLGRGLDSLIPPSAPLTGAGVSQVDVRTIRLNPRQPRSQLDPAQLTELALSIRQHGILQPLILTRDPEQEGYTLIAGERRLQAARQAGLAKVPAIVREAASDQELLELALIENIQRADLSPLEAALAYQTLADDFGLSHDDIARRVGKQRATITNTIRLLKLPQPALDALSTSQISEGHARALLGLPTAQSQQAALKTVVDKGLSVRQTEELVRQFNGQKPERKPAEQRPAQEVDLENRFRDALGTKVRLQRNRKGGGSIVIHFYSDEELEALAAQLLADK